MGVTSIVTVMEHSFLRAVLLPVLILAWTTTEAAINDENFRNQVDNGINNLAANIGEQVADGTMPLQADQVRQQEADQVRQQEADEVVEEEPLEIERAQIMAVPMDRDLASERAEEEKSSEEEKDEKTVSNRNSPAKAQIDDYDAILKSLLTKEEEKPNKGLKEAEDSKAGEDLMHKKPMSQPGQALVDELLKSVREKLNKGVQDRIAVGVSMPNQKDEDKLPKVYRLKNIRSIVTPELLFALAKAGMGDTIVLAANGFPANRLVPKDKVVRLDALCIPTVLKEMMKLISVCNETQFPLLLLKPEAGKTDPKDWSRYKEIVEGADGRKYQWAKLNRAKFFEEAKKAVVIVQTGHPEMEGSIILTKGMILSEEEKKAEKLKAPSPANKTPPTPMPKTTKKATPPTPKSTKKTTPKSKPKATIKIIPPPKKAPPKPKKGKSPKAKLPKAKVVKAKPPNKVPKAQIQLRTVVTKKPPPMKKSEEKKDDDDDLDTLKRKLKELEREEREQEKLQKEGDGKTKRKVRSDEEDDEDKKSTAEVELEELLQLADKDKRDRAKSAIE